MSLLPPSQLGLSRSHKQPQKRVSQFFDVSKVFNPECMIGVVSLQAPEVGGVTTKEEVQASNSEEQPPNKRFKMSTWREWVGLSLRFSLFCAMCNYHYIVMLCSLYIALSPNTRDSKYGLWTACMHIIHAPHTHTHTHLFYYYLN